MCYSCRNINDSDTMKLFSQYNIDLNEYISFSNSVLNDLKTNNNETTNNSNKLKQ